MRVQSEWEEEVSLFLVCQKMRIHVAKGKLSFSIWK